MYRPSEFLSTRLLRGFAKIGSGGPSGIAGSEGTLYHVSFSPTAAFSRWTERSIRENARRDLPGLIDKTFSQAPLAQLAEQLTLNQRVPGSSPGAPTN